MIVGCVGLALNVLVLSFLHGEIRFYPPLIFATTLADLQLQSMTMNMVTMKVEDTAMMIDNKTRRLLDHLLTRQQARA
jgi:hypothetical protein